MADSDHFSSPVLTFIGQGRSGFSVWLPNEGVTPYERFYGMKPERPYENFHGIKPDVGHVHTFRCVVPVAPLKEMLRKSGPWQPDGIQGRRQLSSLESI